VIRPRRAALVTGMTTSSPTPAPDPAELWDVDGLAAYLGVSRHFVYRLTAQHRIRFVRVGKTVRFRPSDVEAWLEAETVAANGPAPAAPRPRRGRPRTRASGGTRP
jgi:excisionase family DNA binding protein